MRVHGLVGVLVVAGLVGTSAGQVFLPVDNVPAGADPTSVAAADFDGDGDLDLAVANFTPEDRVTILRGDGGGGFAFDADYDVVSVDPFDPCCLPIGVAALDVEGDGDQDVAVLVHHIGVVTILRNDGTGTFVLALQTYDVNDVDLAHNEFIAAAELDGDRRVDLVVASPESAGPGHVSVLLNQHGAKAGEFVIDMQYRSGTRHPEGVAAADLDDDGDVDMAVANSTTNDVSILLGDDDDPGSFAFDPMTYAMGTFPSSIVAVDLDGDDDQDLAVTNSGSNSVTVRYNDGAGGFASGITYANLVAEVFDHPTGMAVADFDCLGAPDLAVVNQFNDDVVVLVNRNIGPGLDLLEVENHYPIGRSPNRAVAADLNDDGASDLAVTAGGDDAVSILFNAGCRPVIAHVCRGTKLAAAGKKASALLTCHAKAARTGQGVDPICLGRARGKFLQAFANVEAGGGCATAGDATVIEGRIDGAVADVADDLPAPVPAAGSCAFAKLKAAAKKANGRLACHARAAKKAAQVDAACLARAQSKLVNAFAKADASGGCVTTGDAPAVGAALDALGVDLMAALRH
jgi:FG-GAP-like repeat/FG-GAP repeat